MALVTDNFVLESFSTDFEPFQGTFFKDLSDFSFGKDKTTTNDDLWRNFSLPPTPPVSPASSPLYSETIDVPRAQPECKNDDRDLALCDETSLYFQADKLNEILIKDCMWNGAAFDAGEKKRSQRTPVEKVRLMCQTPPLSESAARILSVDPTEIFPFPIHGNSTSGDETVELGQSDSDEEEVEVDVVTIENSIKREPEDQEKQISTTDCGSIGIESDLSDFSTPLQSGNEDVEDDRDEFVGKIRQRRYRKSTSDGLISSKKSSSSKGQASCSGESDESENDSEFTRATHNVLERKRRNDLKQKFQRLRDCVPELKDNDRAPKVSILRKSWEYISTLKKEENKLKHEYEKQKKTNALLLRQLLALNQAGQ